MHGGGVDGGEALVKSSLPKVITLGYTELNLIYYFTAGEKEVRCWTLYNGSLAPQAAGVIHSDFERGFIKAEVCTTRCLLLLTQLTKCRTDSLTQVCGYPDWVEHGREKGMNAVKTAGKYRQEGKQYLVKDGDIIHLMFNVTADKKK